LATRWRDLRPTEIEFAEHKTGKQKITPRHEALYAMLARHPAGSADAFVLPYLKDNAQFLALPKPAFAPVRIPAEMVRATTLHRVRYHDDQQQPQSRGAPGRH
jgi:hypothetical protein